jgi:hypothetical protein
LAEELGDHLRLAAAVCRALGLEQARRTMLEVVVPGRLSGMRASAAPKRSRNWPNKPGHPGS